VAMATERLGSLATRTSLILGAGEMGEAMAVAIGSVAAEGLLVSNRTWSRAYELASRVGAQPVAWADLHDAVARADVVLASTGAPDVVIDASALSDALPARGGRPLLIVDIGVPRNVDPAVAALEGVTLLDMDDLKAFVDSSMEGRRAELPAAEAIVAEEVERHLAIAAQREVAPLVTSLRERAEAVRLAELERFAGRLGALDDGQRRAVEALTRGIVAKLLHEPTVNVKAQAGSIEGDRLAAALQRLFDL
jgi:glutamyl-tRNA reductase